MKALFSTLVLFAGAPLLAQNSATFPAGFDNTPGGNIFGHWGGSTGRTMQVADRSNVRPRPISQIAFRRLANRASAGAGTIDAEVVMAETPFSLLDTHFDSNQRFNRTVVLKAKVNLPDWSQAQASPKFDLVFKFTRNWVYTSRQALVWTIRYDNAPSSSRVMDRAFGAIQQRTNAASIGTGCSGTSDSLRLDNSGNYSKESGMHLLLGATGGPANAPSWVLIDGKPINVTVPGLCTNLRVTPNILLALGNTNAAGTLTKKYLTVPYVASLQGGTLATQIMFLDPSQSGIPLRLTGGQSGTMPTSSNTAGTASAYAWATGRNAQTGVSDWWFFTGAPIIEAK